VMPRARSLAARALELDPESSDAHATLGNIAFQFDHEWELAEAEFRKSIELNPSNVIAHRFLGSLLLALGRFEEAEEEFRRETRLNPAGFGLGMVALTELQMGHLDATIEYAEKDLRENPDSAGRHIFLGLVYLRAGRRADALKQSEFPVSDENDTDVFDHALLMALLGQPEEARAVIAKVEGGDSKSYNSATHLSLLYAALGEEEKALDLLWKDHDEGDRVFWSFFRGIWFDPMRKNPRFIELVRTYGLPPYTPPALGGAPKK
jgi:tetratricopeptide (TPR) repeat protein